MYFASDNAGPLHPKALEALTRANEGYVPGYGGDDLTARVQDRIRDLFEAPDAAVYLVATGTAANSIALATYCQPFQTVFCTPLAHINVDECNAPEFYMGGGKLTLVPGSDRMTPDALRATIEGEEVRGVHGPQRGPVSITQITEYGNLYSLEDLRALTAVAKDYNLPVHLDGARFANACAALGCTPAEMSWKAGVDVAVFGGTKNGLMGVEAVVMFDPDKAWEFELRRKRGGHLFSKHRYLAAQMDAYLDDNLWMTLAQQSNAKAAHLVEGLTGAAIIRNEPKGNMVFFDVPRHLHQKLQAAGAKYYLWEGTFEGDDPNEMLTGRLVCDWSISAENIDKFVSLVKAG